jgi:hypothetical protein
LQFPKSLKIPRAVLNVQGLEVRFGTDTAGAQSVFPPSRHTAGVDYRWVTGLGANDVDPAPLPEALLELLTGGDGTTGGLDFVCEADLKEHPGSPEGKRHDTLCQLVGRYLRDHGVNNELITLAFAWADRCQPPFPTNEAQKVVSSLAEKELAKQKLVSHPIQTLVSRRFDEIEPDPIHWLWPQRIALGKLSLLVGQPGLGKTFVAGDMMARLSQGLAWPDGVALPAGEAAIVTAEDGASDTLRPRLDAAGADVRKIHHFDCVRGHDGQEHFLSLDRHLPEIEGWLAQYPNVQLLVIDPITAFLGKTDSHNNAEVRGVLGPVAKLAERHGVAIVGITHLSKREAKAINRVIGSIAFVAAARSAWLVAPDPDDDDDRRRLFLSVKNNLGGAPGLAFTIEDGKVIWEGSPVLVSADDIEAEGETSPREEAKAWLRALLESGPVPATKVFQIAKADRIAERTLKRAKKELGVGSRREGEHWVWHLRQDSTATDKYVF